MRNSAACQKKHLDQLFIAVNASGKGSGKVEQHNHWRKLNRQEFLQVLVRIATARYVVTGRVHDVSDAVRILVEEDVLAHVGPEMRHDLNTFRERYCCMWPRTCDPLICSSADPVFASCSADLQEVDQVLRRHEASLRALYTEFSRGDELAATNKEAPSRKTLLAYQSLLGLEVM